MCESDEEALLPGLAPAPTERRAHRLRYALVFYTKRNLRPLLLASFALTSVFLFLRPTNIPHLSRQFATERSDIWNSTLGVSAREAIRRQRPLANDREWNSSRRFWPFRSPKGPTNRMHSSSRAPSSASTSIGSRASPMQTSA
jgi:hypothetical protein